MGAAANAVTGFMSFQTPKTVTIQDWRLGLLLRLSQLGIAAWVLTQIFLNRTYLATEVGPRGPPRNQRKPSPSADGMEAGFCGGER